QPWGSGASKGHDPMWLHVTKRQRHGTGAAVVTSPGQCQAFSEASKAIKVLSHPFKCRFPADTAEGMALPQRIIFPPEKICMDWQQRQRPGAGLFNLGNTCYINVILQCLTYTPPLANYLLSYEHSQSCQQQGFCMMCIMEAHLLNSFLVIGEGFEYGRQENAYEFLRCTLSAMQRACLSGWSK
uniref:Ubiquitin carboxyl-terminal hydrolase 36 n=1 Tax=Malurus cyaneus samueli TaxID=2593467 RepID=A0A8C5TI17_9PASS